MQWLGNHCFRWVCKGEAGSATAIRHCYSYTSPWIACWNLSKLLGLHMMNWNNVEMSVPHRLSYEKPKALGKVWWKQQTGNQNRMWIFMNKFYIPSQKFLLYFVSLEPKGQMYEAALNQK